MDPMASDSAHLSLDVQACSVDVSSPGLPLRTASRTCCSAGARSAATSSAMLESIRAPCARRNSARFLEGSCAASTSVPTW
eukprot:831013-Amphidinium_carterae.2